MSRPRDDTTYLVCEYTGELALSRGSDKPPTCPEHGGDNCLIIVGWVEKDWPQFREPEPPDAVAPPGGRTL